MLLHQHSSALPHCSRISLLGNLPQLQARLQDLLSIVQPASIRTRRIYLRRMMYPSRFKARVRPIRATTPSQ